MTKSGEVHFMGIEPNYHRVGKDVIRGIQEATLPSKEFWHYAKIYAHIIHILGVANVRILPVPWLEDHDINGFVIDVIVLSVHTAFT